MKNLFVTAAIAASTMSSQAASISAITFNDDTTDYANNNNQSVGWEFDVIDTITVSHLAWFDQGSDGLIDDHTVGIWDPSGNLLTSIVIPSGDTATLSNGWRTVAIDEVILGPGSGYIVGGENFEDSDPLFGDGLQLETIPQINYIDAMYSDLLFGGFTRPTSYSIAETGFFGPGFFVVPSPSTGTALVVLGAASCLRRRRT